MDLHLHRHHKCWWLKTVLTKLIEGRHYVQCVSCQTFGRRPSDLLPLIPLPVPLITQQGYQSALIWIWHLSANLLQPKEWIAAYEWGESCGPWHNRKPSVACNSADLIYYTFAFHFPGPTPMCEWHLLHVMLNPLASYQTPPPLIHFPPKGAQWQSLSKKAEDVFTVG
eukprot:1126837-Pelagomonas_calceolata.AAC.1